jgi:gas vesicle protein
MGIRTYCYLTTLLIAALLSGCATMPDGSASSPEREIFIQAIMAGAAIGCAAGGTIGYQTSDEDKRTKRRRAVTGCAAGALAGAIVGRLVAEMQIQNLREAEFDNRSLEKLLWIAQERNREVAHYNDQLAHEITALKRQNKTLRGQIASARLKEARQKREYVQRVAAERSELADKLIAPQRAEYRQTLGNLRIQEAKLDESIKTLERMEEQARVGGRG